MFGEKDILGISERKVDNKSRMFLPDNCLAESDDILVTLDYDDYIEIWNYNTFFKYLEEIKVNNYLYPSNITSFINDINISVDKFKRINLKSLAIKYDIVGECVVIEGCGKCIRIWKKEKFEENKRKLTPIKFN